MPLSLLAERQIAVTEQKHRYVVAFVELGAKIDRVVVSVKSKSWRSFKSYRRLLFAGYSSERAGRLLLAAHFTQASATESIPLLGQVQ